MVVRSAMTISPRASPPQALLVRMMSQMPASDTRACHAYSQPLLAWHLRVVHAMAEARHHQLVAQIHVLNDFQQCWCTRGRVSCCMVQYVVT